MFRIGDPKTANLGDRLFEESIPLDLARKDQMITMPSRGVEMPHLPVTGQG